MTDQKTIRSIISEGMVSAIGKKGADQRGADLDFFVIDIDFGDRGGGQVRLDSSRPVGGVEAIGFRSVCEFWKVLIVVVGK